MNSEQIRLRQLAMEMEVKRGFAGRKDSMRSIKGKRNTGAAVGFKREGQRGRKI